MKSDEELIEELKEATGGLSMMSESDYPFEIMRWEGREEISPQSLRRRAGLDADAPVAETSIAEFFRVAAGEQDWKGAAELDTAKRFQALVRVLEENLIDPRVYRVGEINIGVYIVGRSSQGSWLGISTRVVET